MPSPKLTRADYRVGWICPLEVEQIAAEEMLDETHDALQQPRTDNNVYTLGAINGHNVVIAGLPLTGNCSTATVVAHMRSTFPNLRYGLLVGIGGGVPCESEKGKMIRLGHVVVSQPTGRHSGTVQYDHGKAKTGHFERTGALQPPPVALLNAAHSLAVMRARSDHDPVWNNVQRIETGRRAFRKFKCPGVELDYLYPSDYLHNDPELSCDEQCDPGRRLERLGEEEERVIVHRGTIGSGELVVKDAELRDRLARQDGLLCFEMEAAGALFDFPCLVVRGISDYCDSHKNDLWHGYAAAVAAAYARQLFFHMPIEEIEEAASLPFDPLTLVDHLPVAAGASFDSREEEYNATCLPNTRTDLLQEVSAWALDPLSKPIFWLNGRAGTGKSTISRTVAREFANKGLLGASFLFKRGESDRGSLKKFFTTLAMDLVVSRPATATHIRDALTKNPGLARKAAREQFDQLIYTPLEQVTHHTDGESEQSLIFVIDALDECDHDMDMRLVVSLFAQFQTIQSLRLKVFVTSRPEVPVRLGFKAVRGTYQDLVLHEIEETVIYHDILVFWEHHLARLSESYNEMAAAVEERLPADWPTQSDVHALTAMAVPLFIFAATAYRLISDRRLGEPDELLQELLSNRSHSSRTTSEISETYLPVLQVMVRGLAKEDLSQFVDRFRRIVGAIVTLATPLSRQALSKLLEVPQRSVSGMLERLHSVLDIPESPTLPVRLFHLSFRDFLLGQSEGMTERHAFSIGEKSCHEALANHCLAQLNKLKQDMADIRLPGTSRSEIDAQRINEALPPEVQYACLHWVHHLQGSESLITDADPWCLFLVRHFLHWLEALSLIGRAWEIPDLIMDVQSCLDPDMSDHMASFLDDASRLVLAHLSVIDSSPLQIYSSMILFAPKRSVVRSRFERSLAQGIQVPPTVDEDWGPCLQVLEGHRGSVQRVVFSPDSSLLLSTSIDLEIRLWRVRTGECLQVIGRDNLHKDSGGVSVCFSPSSELMATAFETDRIASLWRTDTGECVKVLAVGIHDLRSVAFLGETQLIATTFGNTMPVWDVDSGRLVTTVQPDVGVVICVAVSPDAALVAPLPSWRVSQKDVAVTETKTWSCIGRWTVNGPVRALQFLPDSTQLGLIMEPDEAQEQLAHIDIWSVNTGTRIRRLTIADAASGFYLSRNWSYAVSARGAWLRVQDLKWGRVKTIEVGEHPVHLDISVYSKRIATALSNKIHIFRTDGGKTSTDAPSAAKTAVSATSTATAAAAHAIPAPEISISPNSALIATGDPVSGSAGGWTLRVRSLDTLKPAWSLLGYEGVQIRHATFSHDSKLLALCLRYPSSTGSYIDDNDGDDNNEGERLSIRDAATGQRLNNFSGTHDIVCFAHDNKTVASSYLGTICIWAIKESEDTSSVKALVQRDCLSRVMDMAFSSDSKAIISVHRDGTAQLSRMGTGQHTVAIQHHPIGVVLSPRHLLSVSCHSNLFTICHGFKIRVVRYTDGGRFTRVRDIRNEGYLCRTALSHDSKFIGATSHNGTAILWSVESGQRIWTSEAGILGGAREPLSFRSDEPGRLHLVTGLGDIDVSNVVRENKSSASEAAKRSGYGLSTDKCWIMHNETRLLWLPQQYRPESFASRGSTVILQLASGRVHFIKFSDRTGSSIKRERTLDMRMKKK